MEAVSNDLQRLWDRARAHLERARDSLTDTRSARSASTSLLRRNGSNSVAC